MHFYKPIPNFNCADFYFKMLQLNSMIIPLLYECYKQYLNDDL